MGIAKILFADKRQAIQKIHQIQNGKWDRNNPEPPKGRSAYRLWDDSTFSCGMEYGAIVVLMQIFDISSEEL